MIISNYTTSRLGTGGQGFNWESGSWGDSPKWLVDCFLIIDGIIADHQQEQTRQSQVHQNPNQIINYRQ